MRSPAPDRARTNLDWERSWWSVGLTRIAGVDEVGRGALAGPLVAAAVILPVFDPGEPSPLAGLTDSKRLTPDVRERWFEAIGQVAIAVSIGVVECAELDLVGLGPANRLAMERAVFQLPNEPDAVLLDAFVTELDMPQVGIIDGDAHCLSIAAASVIAKVFRDRRMRELHEQDGRYGFDEHKGYGTPLHLEALRRHGPCSAHRRCFAPVAGAFGLA